MNSTIKKFKTIILSYFKKHGRILPWRYEKDPYKILISEIMLQQTQVARVIPKYREWLEKFPTIESLANASLRDVLIAWQGLGYNRRGKYLKEAAKIIMKDKRYRFMFCHPERAKRVEGSIIQKHHVDSSPDAIGRDQNDMVSLLQELPGIGHATASAIITYAFNKPTVFIETNIRSVYLYFFFKKSQQISDKQLAEIVVKTMDYENPRDWYYALTDYGNFLKTKEKFKNIQSKHYIKQSSFIGSRRQLRARVLFLITHSNQTIDELTSESGRDEDEVISVLNDLVKEGFIINNSETYQLV